MKLDIVVELNHWQCGGFRVGTVVRSSSEKEEEEEGVGKWAGGAVAATEGGGEGGGGLGAGDGRTGQLAVARYVTSWGSVTEADDALSGWRCPAVPECYAQASRPREHSRRFRV